MEENATTTTRRAWPRWVTEELERAGIDRTASVAALVARIDALEIEIRALRQNWICFFDAMVVDRTDPAGIVHDGQGVSRTDALLVAVARALRERNRPDAHDPKPTTRS